MRKWRKPVLDWSIYEDHISRLDSLFTRLDNNNTICNAEYAKVYSEFVAMPVNLEDHCRLVFSGMFFKNKFRGKVNPVMAKVIDNLRVSTLKSRSAETVSALKLEAELRAKEGWYFVFNTLTVTGEYLDDVFKLGSKCWTDYVRLVDRSVGIRVYGRWRTAMDARRDGNNFHSYFAVVERGSRSGRLHIHVIHMMKELPIGCYDPNAGLNMPVNREISYMKKFWKFGFSSPIAVRFNNSDAYGKAFWRWPVVKGSKGFDSLPCKGVGAIVNYVGKYLTKQLDSKIEKGEVLKWRIRTSRNLGKSMILPVVELLSMSQMRLVMLNSGRMLQSREIKLPTKLFKKLVLIRMVNLWKKKNSLQIRNLERVLSPQPNIIKQLAGMIANSLDISQLRIGLLQAKHIKGMVDYEIYEFKRVLYNFYDNVFHFDKVNYQCATYTGGVIC